MGKTCVRCDKEIGFRLKPSDFCSVDCSGERRRIPRIVRLVKDQVDMTLLPAAAPGSNSCSSNSRSWDASISFRGPRPLWPPREAVECLESRSLRITNTRRKTVSAPIMKYFEFAHLPQNLQGVSGDVYALACSMDAQLPDGPEKSAGLRKLLEAKDCFVRAKLPLE